MLDPPWSRMPAIALGRRRAGDPTADVFVTVTRADGEPLLRLDVHEECGGPFREAIVWKELVVVGYGLHVHVIDVQSHAVASRAMSGYFGHLYPLVDHLLIADAERLHCFDSSGAKIWQSARLGIDGVVVQKVGQGRIEGEGEWDPPGGARPFALSLSSGEPIAE